MSQVRDLGTSFSALGTLAMVGEVRVLPAGRYAAVSEPL
jgi:hypothetical protein